MKKTIAELRNTQVERLADIIYRANNEAGSLDVAINLMNRFYRLCGADERLLYLENDERTANRRSTIELSERTQRTLDRLQADFKKYGLKLVYFGYLPTICYKDSTNTAIESYFYN